jgi:hypothetical protein
MHGNRWNKQMRDSSKPLQRKNCEKQFWLFCSNRRNRYIKTEGSQNVSPKRCSNDLREAAFSLIFALSACVGVVWGRK